MRAGQCERKTRETDVNVSVELEGSGNSEITTGLGFFDHMLDALSCHSGMNIALRCTGDLVVDDHHTVEDCALALGSALDSALGERRGIERFGYAYAPLDEALARAVVDLSGRPFAHVKLNFTREKLGDVATENLTHFFISIASTLRASVHIDLLRGSNDHHRAEAAFKAFALALKQAITRTGEQTRSTKGSLA